MMIEDKVKELLAAVLGLNADEITGESTIENVETWDSMAVLSISLAIEEEFSLQLSPEEQLQMNSYEAIVRLLNSKGL